MNKRFIIVLFCILLMISLSLNALLFKSALKVYRQQKLFQIDPSNSLFYSDLNKAILNKKKDSIRIVLFGDSRIYQWNPLPELSGCEFINRGIPGETTSQSILRIEKDLLQLNPDIVIIQIGGNDCNSIGTLPDMIEYITGNSIMNIDTIIKTLEKNKIKGIILSIFPFSSVDIYHLPVWTGKSLDAVKEFNKYLRKYNSSDIRIIDCDKIFIENNKMKRIYAVDMLHINKEGYLTLNNFISPVLEELIKKDK